MFVPGSDDNHFCKPTDVAVAENGDFFVSDGYEAMLNISIISNGYLFVMFAYFCIRLIMRIICVGVFVCEYSNPR